jgi:PKD repeat protein
LGLKEKEAPMKCCIRRLGAIATVAMVLVIPFLIMNGTFVTATEPEVVIFYPIEGETYRGSETIELNASESYDPDGQGITIFWKDSVDGTLGYGPVLHVHLSVGAHLITCEVTDDNNEKASATRQVSVLAMEPPIARLEADEMTAVVFEIITFTGAKSSDPDFGVTDYYFDFGDGYNTGWLKSTTATHAFSGIGDYKVGLTVKDTDGLTASTNLTITIMAKPKVEDNTTRSNVFIVALIAILVIIIIIILVAWNRIRVRGKREEELEMQRRLKNPGAYRPGPGPEQVLRRSPPQSGQARKVRLPTVKDEAYQQIGPRKVKAPIQGKGRRP